MLEIILEVKCRVVTVLLKLFWKVILIDRDLFPSLVPPYFLFFPLLMRKYRYPHSIFKHGWILDQIYYVKFDSATPTVANSKKEPASVSMRIHVVF